MGNITIIIFYLIMYYLFLGIFLAIYHNEYKIINHKLFTVTIPQEREKQDNVLQIINAFKRKFNVLTILSILISIYFLLPLPKKLWVFLISLLALIILFSSYAKVSRKKLIHIKETDHWSFYGDEGYIYDEDYYWKYGIFGPQYNNPNDPNVLKENSSDGSNYTFNFGNKKTKIIMAAILLVICLILFWVFGYSLILDYNHKLADAKIDGNSIKLTGQMYERFIPIASIKKIELITSIPDGIRTGGSANGIYSTGNFNLDNYGKCKMYVASRHKLYIVAYTDDNIIIFNDDEEAKTQKIYDELSKILVKH